MAVNVLLHAGVTLLYFSSLTQFVQPRPVPTLWKVSLHLISCAFLYDFSSAVMDLAFSNTDHTNIGEGAMEKCEICSRLFFIFLL